MAQGGSLYFDSDLGSFVDSLSMIFLDTVVVVLRLFLFASWQQRSGGGLRALIASSFMLCY